MAEFASTDGLLIGGQGTFTKGPAPACELRHNDSGLIEALDTLAASWEGVFKIGLYQNDWTPDLFSVLASIVPCDFSGYSGLAFLYSWSAAVMRGIHAYTEANPVVWTHDGGPIQNYAYGYYVIDGTGHLAWAERFCPAPKIMAGFGTKLRVTPAYTLKNEAPDGGTI